MTGSVPSLGRALLPFAVAVAGLACSLSQLAQEKYNGDERQWIYHGEQSWEHLRRGEVDHPYWSESALLWGFASPPVAKYLIGIGLQGAGKESPDDEVTTKKKWTGPPYPRDVLAAGRFPSAVLGAVGLFFFFLVARRVGGDRIATLASVLLAVSPVWLASSRRAMVDMHGASLALIALWLFISARERLLGDGAIGRGLAAFAGAGVFLGLSVGAKFNAAGVPIGLGLLLLWDLGRARRSRQDGRRAAAIVAAGVAMAGCALAVFVVLYPYLHEDGWNRFAGILRAWRDVRGLHVEHQLGRFGEAYAPGWISFRETAAVLFLPGARALPWLILPAAAVGFARTAAGRRRSPDWTRLSVWLLLIPAAIATVFSPGRFALSWIAWIGFAGATFTALLPRGPDRRDPATRRATEALVFYSLGTLAVVMGTTYITWPRYYISLFPPLLLVAAAGLEELRRRLVRRGGSAAGVPVTLAIAFGIAVVFTAYPETGKTKIANLTESGWTGPGALLLAASVVSFCLFPLSLLRVGGRGSPEAPSDPAPGGTLDG